MHSMALFNLLCATMHALLCLVFPLGPNLAVLRLLLGLHSGVIPCGYSGDHLECKGLTVGYSHV